MNRGDFVTIRTYGGKLSTRRVWEVTEQAVYIHDEENYQKHIRGLACLNPVGFPRDAIVEEGDNERTNSR